MLGERRPLLDNQLPHSVDTPGKLVELSVKRAIGDRPVDRALNRAARPLDQRFQVRRAPHRPHEHSRPRDEAGHEHSGAEKKRLDLRHTGPAQQRAKDTRDQSRDAERDDQQDAQGMHGGGRL